MVHNTLVRMVWRDSANGLCSSGSPGGPAQPCSLHVGGDHSSQLYLPFPPGFPKGELASQHLQLSNSKFLLLNLLFIAWLPSMLPHHLATRASGRLKGGLGVQLALLLGRTSSLDGLMSPVGELTQPGHL